MSVDDIISDTTSKVFVLSAIYFGTSVIVATVEGVAPANFKFCVSSAIPKLLEALDSPNFVTVAVADIDAATFTGSIVSPPTPSMT